MRKVILIGLIGRAQAGKSTSAKELVNSYGFTKIAFADALKEVILNAGMATREELWGTKTENSRYLLQKIGTEIFRKQVDPEYWVKKTKEKIEKIIQTSEQARIVVDDVRFPNEADVIRSLGGTLIKLERIGFIDKTAGSDHDSERLVDTINPHILISVNEGDVSFLLQSIRSSISNLI